MAAIKGCEYRYGHNTEGFMVPDTFSNNSRLKHFCSLTLRRHIKFDIEYRHGHNTAGVQYTMYRYMWAQQVSYIKVYGNSLSVVTTGRDLWYHNISSNSIHNNGSHESMGWGGGAAASRLRSGTKINIFLSYFLFFIFSFYFYYYKGPVA